MKRLGIQKGFTIVELLIVVVVIAILAAITIVAYNGISQRSKESTAQSATSQAVKKIMAEIVTNNDQAPEDISLLGLRSDGSTSYQYYRSTATSPNTFCVTATTNGISYFASSTTTTPQKGSCPGHGAHGAEVITNMALNPQVTDWLQSYSGVRITTGRWFGGGGSGISSLETGTTPVGTTFGRKKWTVTPTGNHGDTGFNGGTLDVTAGEVYTISAYLRPSSAKWHEMSVNTYDIGSDSAVRRRSPAQLLPGNVWTRVSWTYTVPANVDRMHIFVDMTGMSTGGGTYWAVGETLDITGYMVTKGPTLHAFADGNSTNWRWTGEIGRSQSTGEPF